jgi:hypothetical protein
MVPSDLMRVPLENLDSGCGCSGCGDRGADQGRKGLRAGLPHDSGAMVVNRTLADAEISGNVLAWMASEDEVQDLTLTRGQAGNA